MYFDVAIDVGNKRVTTLVIMGILLPASMLTMRIPVLLPDVRLVIRLAINDEIGYLFIVIIIKQPIVDHIFHVIGSPEVLRIMIVSHFSSFPPGFSPPGVGLLYGQQTGTASGLGTMTSQPSGVVMRPRLMMTCTSSAL